jgi:hypothetical protein
MGKRLSLTDTLRRAIGQSGESRYAICKKLDIDQSSMSRFMHRQAGLTVDALDALAEFLGLTLVPIRKSKKGK